MNLSDIGTPETMTRAELAMAGRQVDVIAQEVAAMYGRLRARNVELDAELASTFGPESRIPDTTGAPYSGFRGDTNKTDH